MKFAIFSNSPIYINALAKILGSDCVLVVYDKPIKNCIFTNLNGNNFLVYHYSDFSKYKAVLSEVDVLLCYNFNILPKRIIELPICCCINIHPAELPIYAGKYPWPMLVEDNASSSFVCAHFMETAVDSGLILAKLKYYLYDADDYTSWLKRTEQKIIKLSIKLIKCQSGINSKNLLRNSIKLKPLIEISQRSKNPSRIITRLDLTHFYKVIKINKFLGGTLINAKNGDNFIVYDAELEYLAQKKSVQKQRKISLKFYLGKLFLTDGEINLMIVSHEGIDFYQNMDIEITL